MLFGQRHQHVQCAIPIAARLMRIDRRRVQHFARFIHDGDLAAGTNAGINAHRRVRAGGCCQQQIFQVARKNVDRFQFRFLAQR